MKTYFGAPEHALAHQLGGGGLEVISDTSAHTGKFYAFFVADAATIDSITAPGVDGTITGFAIPEGSWVYPGIFTSITLTSGKIFAYKMMA